ncbi:MAG: ATP synthase F1 subunit gamma [Ignavibacteria bacterium]|jgi:F-type H+-transporting ATPase subunit gamma
MATLRDIKRRIIGVQNTQQITKAMKMVAAARLRRAQENIITARPYSRKISEVLSNLFAIEKNIDNPFIETRETKRIAIFVVTSDRGLCGAFNMNVIRRTEELIKTEYNEFYENENVDLYCIGKRGNEYFTKRNYNVVSSEIGIFSGLKFDFVVKVNNDIKQKFLDNHYDLVLIVYNEFKSVVQQNLTVKQLLPVKPSASENVEEINADYIYEPDKMHIINSLIPRYLNSQMWNILLESYAAELGARMTAMDMATENAHELIRMLKINYNKARQASITTEILEIVSGADALKNE